MAKRRWEHGFTLIELLVVIAILALLAAILFPVLTRVRERACQNGCASQLRQLTQAFSMYQADYHEVFPFLHCRGGSCPQTSPSNYGFYSWTWMIYPYAQSFVLFFCPSDQHEPKYSWPPGSDSFYSYRDTSAPLFGYLFSLVPSWGYNARYLSPGRDPYNPDEEPFVPLPLSKVSQPANTVLLVESAWYPRDRNGRRDPTKPIGFYRVYPPSSWRGAPPLDELSYGHCWPRHFEQFANTAFVDGHVKGMSLSSALSREELWQAEK